MNPKTVAQGRIRTTVEDRKTGPQEPRSSGPSLDEDAVIVAFRRPASLPLVDWLDALQPTIPHLTRSSLDRCLQRNGISRLPDVGDKPGKRTFKRYPTGLFHIDIADPRTAQGKLPLFVAIDRTRKVAFARLGPKAGKLAVAQFLRDPIEAAPYRVHTGSPTPASRSPFGLGFCMTLCPSSTASAESTRSGAP